MRISDGSSDVCSSDLSGGPAPGRGPGGRPLPADRDPGTADPRDAPAPPDRAGAGEADRGVQAVAGHHPRPDRDPRGSGRTAGGDPYRSEEHTSELQSLMRI